jgi:hypothetical protein
LASRVEEGREASSGALEKTVACTELAKSKAKITANRELMNILFNFFIFCFFPHDILTIIQQMCSLRKITQAGTCLTVCKTSTGFCKICVIIVLFQKKQYDKIGNKPLKLSGGVVYRLTAPNLKSAKR